MPLLPTAISERSGASFRATAIESMTPLTSIEICAGAGGQALGLEQAGFEHLAAVEIDPWAAETLRRNRPQWNIVGPRPDDRRPSEGGPGDVHAFDATVFNGQVDLLAGGVPCPPFSIAGKQLGASDERDLFPQALRLIAECAPRAVMLENVRGLLSPKFDSYRAALAKRLRELGYVPRWKLLQASFYGVPQNRARAVLVALAPGPAGVFDWPEHHPGAPRGVGETLADLMGANGWEGARAWSARAGSIAPTLVGGSKKHGGPDLGPTRARREWAKLGVDGRGIAYEAPLPGFSGSPRLTVRMAARIQGFPDIWAFTGRKTASYRQVGNAFPPPVARTVGVAIAAALRSAGTGEDAGVDPARRAA